jgi:1,4-dihydroxy-2-naphthoyl-CoA hydrolase
MRAGTDAREATPARAALVDLYRLTKGLAERELIDVPAGFAEQIPDDCLLSIHGIVLTRIGRGTAVVEMTVDRGHLNQRGVVQAGAIVALADATAGWASYSSIEHGRFTTIDLNTNLLRAAREGDRLQATATPVRLGRKVQVIDVLVEALTGENGSSPATPVARFSCSQLVLDPPGAGQEKN